MSEQQQYRTMDKFDRMMAQLASLPDVTHTKPTPIVVHKPFLGTQTFYIQTYRHIERDGENSKSVDTLFLQYVDDQTTIRIPIPHEAIQAILRQHDSLATKVRRKVGKEQAAIRAARGEVPAFLRKKRGKKEKK